MDRQPCLRDFQDVRQGFQVGAGGLGLFCEEDCYVYLCCTARMCLSDLHDVRQGFQGVICM